MRNISFGKPMIGEEEKKAVMEALSSPTLVHGPRTEEFEHAFSNFTGAPSSVAVSSCTAALHLSYFHFGIGPGDEVILPAQTHVATAHAVELCGGKPVFVDSEEDTGNMDLGQIESKITPRTRALSVVHFLGMPVDMSRVMTLARKHRLFVVEDCALAVGTYWDGIHAGLHGDVGCFSFYPVKHLTTSEGGMLVTRNEELAQAIRRKKAFGVDRSVNERIIPGIYDVTLLGFNYRMSEIQATLGVEQLKKIPTFLARRRENFEILRKALGDIEEIRFFREATGKSVSSHYCLSFLLDKSLVTCRPEMIRYLKAQGVGTSIYYPRPVPHFSYYQAKYGYEDKSFPVARWISEASIALPVGPHLAQEDMFYIAEKVKEAVLRVKAEV